ncbi:hypothetical protein WEH80_20160 [Actinomycetes bacterium KLBMP 9759]
MRGVEPPGELQQLPHAERPVQGLALRREAHPARDVDRARAVGRSSPAAIIGNVVLPAPSGPTSRGNASVRTTNVPNPARAPTSPSRSSSR